MRTLALALTLLIPLSQLASAQESRPIGPTAQLDQLLKRYVDKQGNVDYAAWKKNRAHLAALRSTVKAFAKLDTKGWSKKATLAHWINVYNALTIQGIIEFCPLKSIKDKVGKRYDIWKHYTFGPRKLSLNAIEHEILRPLGDPRIHAAIVCASKGCPPLRAEAYREGKLDRQLDDNVRVWLASPIRGLKFQGKTLHLSKIFFWFGKDFGSGSVADNLRWVSRFVDAKTKRRLAAKGLKVVELDWDWALNKR
ncbi:MAG: DUF547 domain-containing protein [Planctomycetes bacterium]|nr:DUF547 domain-containing protein [Planctomycetota bacterium]